MKTFIACLGTETNTFSPIPTGLETFAETMLYHGDATAHDHSLFAGPLHVWRQRTEAHQGQVVESLAAFAQPAGITVRAVYESLRDEVLDDLRRALPVDMVLLNMHGAMVADGYDDCEGDLLTRVRDIVGPDVPVGAELDLHCHITEAMLEAATAIITFKEYPHTDPKERAAELFEICLAAAEGRTKPVMATYDLRMINSYRTPEEPLRSFVDRMQALEGEDGILSVSFGHGFPYADVADVGGKVLVVADGDAGAAAGLAERLGREIWEMRDEIAAPRLTIDQALDRALEVDGGPVVLADVADNAGGGAPSDATFVLARILERGIADVLNGLYWDPVAVRFCKEAGEGATLQLRIGGKCGPASGNPLDLEVRVRRIVEGATQSFGPPTNGLGDAVWVSAANGIDLVLNSARTQVFHPDAFTGLGLDPATKRLVVVKSTQHFYAGFAPLAKEVLYIASPGTLSSDYAAMPYSKRGLPYWPKVANPWAK
ncbi:MAG: M81 family metallopeptidase [Alphaproteobacteria bacterium]|jgi:microcystin degradation protein MlrC|nr:M81 family metallopeptidase [Alphaproteobacteria bacterium]